MTTALLSAVFLPLAAEGGEESEQPTIEIGHHVEREFRRRSPSTSTRSGPPLLAAGLVLLLGLPRPPRADPGHRRPRPHQDPADLGVGRRARSTRQVEDNLGRVHPYVTPLAISLFFFILFANWFELLPTELNHDVHLTPAPTADVNLTYALALLVMISVWIYGIRSKGVKGYFKHFVEPFPILLPLNILEELIKPLTLALRLFGNIFAGGIMLVADRPDAAPTCCGPRTSSGSCSTCSSAASRPSSSPC